MSQVNDSPLHPESNGKPLKGFEQEVTQFSLWLRKVTGGYVESMVRCAGAAGAGSNGNGEKQTWGIMTM